MVRLRNSKEEWYELPPTVSLRRIPLSIHVPSVPNAMGDGDIVTGRSRVEARRISLTGSIYLPDRQAIRDEADVIAEFLQHTPVEVYKWANSERRLYAYPQGMSHDWIDAGAELGIDIPMLVPDPYWYGDLIGASLDAGSNELTVEGSSPTYPEIQFCIKSSVTGLSIENETTGQKIEIDGSYNANTTVYIDTQRYTAFYIDHSNDGARMGIVDRLSDEFILNGFSLVPGDNEITASYDVLVRYRPRWV